MKKQSVKSKGRADRIIAVFAMIILFLGLFGFLYQCSRQDERDDPIPVPEHVDKIEFETDDDLIFGG